ncbi:MAG TPA: hypothetical protein VMZ53_26415 [Kofleriaceae bacterium]|nr:hypothetical protein [Kofleriaceae bacterium]
MGTITRALVLCVAVVLVGCAEPREAFQCATSDQCTHAGQVGTCESTGFCSFDDRGCPSGKRYGESAGDDLSGECVVNPNGDFIVASAAAINHVTIAVSFSQAPDSTEAVNLANYSVDGLTLVGPPTLTGSIVTIPTVEQADTTYTVTVSNISRASDDAPLWMGSATFKGRPEFKVVSAASATNGLAQVTFSGPPDLATAMALSSYSIPGLTLSGTPIVVGNTVTLVTSPQSATSYTVTVSNIVRAGDAEALTASSASFTGRLGFNVVSAAAPNSATVVVTFDAPPNATQAATLANFSIPGLTLSGVPVVAGNTVTLTTSPQASQTYTVTVSNVTRGSDAEPLIIAARNFSGVNTFNVASAAPSTSNNVQVTFDAPPNATQAGTLANYSIPGLAPTAVSYPGTGSVVTLTVPAMAATTYTVTVNNVTRATDAEPLANKMATFTGRPKFNVVSATSLSSTSMRITFDGPPSATNGVVLGNYSVNNGLALSGTPAISGNTVTITTATQSAVTYTVTVSGVTRSGDNEPLLANSTTFTGRTSFNVVSASAISSTSVAVTFDGPPGAGATTAANYSIPTLTVSNATYPGTGNVVTLTTAPQTGGMYTLTVNNVTRTGDLEALTAKSATFNGRLPFNVTMAQATLSTQVQVTFSAAPNATQAGNVNNYFISGLAISAVSVTGSVATLTTAAQANQSYTVVVSNVTRGIDGELLTTNSFTFTGRTPFNVSSATPVTSTSVAVTFSGPPGAGATTAANYSIPGLAVSAAAYPGTGNVVTLTTAAQSSTSYTLTVDNVTRTGDVEPLTNKTATFTGRLPFNVTGAAATLNTRITVTFDGTPVSGMANTASNYVLSGGLAVTSVNYPGTGNTVTVNTSAQTGGTNYTVTVNNVTRTDGEALTVKTANFTGRSAFNVTGATSVGNTSLSVTFSATPGTGATTLGNYMITAGSLSLSGTPVVSGNTVTLTTSTQSAGSSYTISVANVLRSGDNEPLTNASATFTGKAGFNVASAASVNHNTMSVTFDATPVITEAQTEANYTFSGGLTTNGAPVLVGNTVTIPTSTQAGQLYTVTVNNVHRAGDNFPLSVNAANFTHTLFNVTSAVSTSTHSVDVTFDAPPNSGQATTMSNYAFSGGVVPTGTPVLNGSTVTIPTSDQVSGTLTVTVSNVTRGSDGTILSNNMATFAGRTPFTISAMSTSSGAMSVTYSDPPQVTPASTNSNYSVSGLTLSNPSLSGNTVSFTTTAQVATTYTVMVSNVLRASDNEPLTVNTASFAGTALSTPVVTNVVVQSTNVQGSGANGTTFYNVGTATVIITGSEFTGVSCPSGVTLDDTNNIGTPVSTPATSCTVDSGTQITATFPSGIRSSYGGWNVKVTNAVGTNTTSTVKLVVKAGLLVSEILTHAGGGNGADHEFLELYNPTASALNLSTLGVRLHVRTQGGTNTQLALTYTRTTIPSRGFFLITSTGSNNSDRWDGFQDAQYNSATADLVDNGGVYISLSTTANVRPLDKVGWGTQVANGFEGTALPNISPTFSVSRKPNSSDASTDTDANATDFNPQTTIISPKNSLGQAP